MKVENIKSDKVLKMTSTFHRVFNAAGCNHMCHACKEMIPIGVNFKLSTVEEKGYKNDEGSPRRRILKIPDEHTQSKEVMLCENCTPEKFKYYQEKMFSDNKKEFERLEKLHEANGGGCFRINGKIIH